MVSLEKTYANYLSRKYVVASSVCLFNCIEKFYVLKTESVFTTDNFFSLNDLEKITEATKALYYKPRFGFLGKIEVVKDFCQKNKIVFIEDFTENFSANRIIDGKSVYAGMLGNVSVCVKDNVFFYATDDDKLANFLQSAAKEPEVSQKENLIEFLFDVEVEKRKRRITVANYVVLISYFELFHFLTQIDECDGETASYPVFAVVALKAKALWQYLVQSSVQCSLWNNLLLLPTNITEDELKHIIDLILEFYKKEC